MLFVLSLGFDQLYDMRKIHDEEYTCHDNGESPEVVAPHFFENVKRVGFSHLHEEHEICIKNHVDKIDRNCHTHKQKQTFRNLLEAGANVSREGEHDGIGGKKNMYREAVDMHEIEKWKLCPRGEEKSRERARNTNGIKKIIQHLGGLQGVNGDENDIDAAKVERKIAYIIIAEGGKTDDLNDLVKHQKACVYEADPFSSVCIRFFIKPAAKPAEQDENKKPREMKRFKMRESDALYNGVRGFKKILKQPLSLQR